MKLRLLLACAVCALTCLPTYAQAQDRADADDKLNGFATIGIAAIPEYEGADHHRFIPLVNGRLAKGERYIAVEGTAFRANIVGAKGFEFGPVLNIGFGRDNDVEDKAVARLPEIDDAYEVGAFGAVSFSAGGKGTIRASLQGVRDVSDVHDGFAFTAGASYSTPIGKRTLISVELSSSYVDDAYAETYFSVTPAGSAASGLSRFTAQAGLKDVGLSLTTSYQVTDNWGIVGYASYRRLLGDFADSPVVSRNGSADQFSGGLGIAYSF